MIKDIDFIRDSGSNAVINTNVQGYYERKEKQIHYKKLLQIEQKIDEMCELLDQVCNKLANKVE